MAKERLVMNTADTIQAYSEWLDGEHLLPKDEQDERTHENLVQEFMQYWDSVDGRADLAGREKVNADG